jgi:hypothetical protein
LSAGKQKTHAATPGVHLLHGVMCGNESDLLIYLRKTIKRNNGLFGTGKGHAGNWSWKKNEAAKLETVNAD